MSSLTKIGSLVDAANNSIVANNLYSPNALHYKAGTAENYKDTFVYVAHDTANSDSDACTVTISDLANFSSEISYTGLLLGTTIGALMLLY